jgi:hypothetical protein
VYFVELQPAAMAVTRQTFKALSKLFENRFIENYSTEMIDAHAVT